MSARSGRRRALREFARTLALSAPSSAEIERLDIALTHASFAAERSHATAPLDGHGGRADADNERLEFLGDAILGAAVAHELYDRKRGLSEGKLSPLRASLVSQSALAQTARRLNVADLLLVGKGERRTGAAMRPSIIGSAVEAIVGAIYLSRGFEAARAFIAREHLAHVKPAAGSDPKTALQEYVQAKYKEAPHYAVAAVTGPPHDRTFNVVALVRGHIVGAGEGATKKQAESAAAAEGLQTCKRRPASRVR
ncbi:MAG: ribonuclease III [Candidatus Eremiobacter antarcticus]|nr:ribonuclease III [Candidatus Eremiobacteraeota bacterium]MBC5808212.1 ribonuclease III [Candidatus Eremiobacteraeota bacterium]